jgi:hypothetical protein
MGQIYTNTSRVMIWLDGDDDDDDTALAFDMLRRFASRVGERTGQQMRTDIATEGRT